MSATEGWVHSGNCPVCGAPIFGRIHVGEPPVVAVAGERTEVREAAYPEGIRTCPKTCPHGAG